MEVATYRSDQHYLLPAAPLAHHDGRHHRHHRAEHEAADRPEGATRAVRGGEKGGCRLPPLPPRPAGRHDRPHIASILPNSPPSGDLPLARETLRWIKARGQSATLLPTEGPNNQTKVKSRPNNKIGKKGQESKKKFF